MRIGRLFLVIDADRLPMNGEVLLVCIASEQGRGTLSSKDDSGILGVEVAEANENDGLDFAVTEGGEDIFLGTLKRQVIDLNGSSHVGLIDCGLESHRMKPEDRRSDILLIRALLNHVLLFLGLKDMAGMDLPLDEAGGLWNVHWKDLMTTTDGKLGKTSRELFGIV